MDARKVYVCWGKRFTVMCSNKLRQARGQTNMSYFCNASLPKRFNQFSN